MIVRFNRSSSRTTLDGGTNTSSGSHMRDTIHTRNSNIIRFPALTSLPDNSHASERELSISDETGAACALAVVASCFVVALSALLYAGYNLFFLFDLG